MRLHTQTLVSHWQLLSWSELKQNTLASVNHLISSVVCADYSDERDRLFVKDNRLPRPTSFRRFVYDSWPVLLVVRNVDIVAVAATVAVPQQQPDINTHTRMVYQWSCSSQLLCFIRILHTTCQLVLMSITWVSRTLTQSNCLARIIHGSGQIAPRLHSELKIPNTQICLIDRFVIFTVCSLRNFRM